MTRTFTVHGVHHTSVAIPAKTAEGHDVTAQMPALIVELVPDDPAQKTITWVETCPTAESQAAALKLFEKDAKIEVGPFMRAADKKAKG
jgi:hypothetical protein